MRHSAMPEVGHLSWSRRVDHLLSSKIFNSQGIEQVKSTVLKIFKTGDGVYQITLAGDLLYLTTDKKRSCPPEGQ